MMYQPCSFPPSRLNPSAGAHGCECDATPNGTSIMNTPQALEIENGCVYM